MVSTFSYPHALLPRASDGKPIEHHDHDSGNGKQYTNECHYPRSWHLEVYNAAAEFISRFAANGPVYEEIRQVSEGRGNTGSGAYT